MRVINSEEYERIFKEFCTVVDYSNERDKEAYCQHLIDQHEIFPEEKAQMQKMHRQIMGQVKAGGSDIPPSVAQQYHDYNEKMADAQMSRDEKIAWHESELKRLRGY